MPASQSHDPDYKWFSCAQTIAVKPSWENVHHPINPKIPFVSSNSIPYRRKSSVNCAVAWSKRLSAGKERINQWALLHFDNTSTCNTLSTIPVAYNAWLETIQTMLQIWRTVCATLSRNGPCYSGNWFEWNSMVLTPPPGPLKVYSIYLEIEFSSMFILFSYILWDAWYHVHPRTNHTSICTTPTKIIKCHNLSLYPPMWVTSTCQCLAYLWSVSLPNHKILQLCHTVFSFPGPAKRCSCHFSAGEPACGCATYPKHTNCTTGTPWYTIHDVPSQATWGLGTGHLVTRLAMQLAQEAFLRIHAPCLCGGGRALVRLTLQAFTQRIQDVSGESHHIDSWNLDLEVMFDQTLLPSPGVFSKAFRTIE